MASAPLPCRPAGILPRAFLAVSWGLGALLLLRPAPWLFVLTAGVAAAGLWFARRQSRTLRAGQALALLLPVIAGVPARTPVLPPVEDSAVISALVTSEETLLSLSPAMAALSKELLNLQLPGHSASVYFNAAAAASDLAAFPATPEAALTVIPWPVSPEKKPAGTRPALWQPLFDQVSWFEQAKLYLISGRHPGGSESVFETAAGFDALARLKSGHWASLHGKLQLRWERTGPAGTDAANAPWQITSWETQSMESVTSPARLFAESLDAALPGGDAFRLRKSGHYAASVQYYREGMKKEPHPYFSTISANHKPGVTAADVNGDGFDDLYITVRIGTNKLLINHGDGTFSEESEKYGLALTGHTTASLFADFDNDGDLDAMLGRSLLKTTYLENTGGIFVQHKAPPWSPMAVVSMSAADYNRDGLLDVYLCTYRPAAPPQSAPGGGVAPVAADNFDWMDEFLPPDQAAEYRRRLKAERARTPDGAFPDLLDQTGPPNLLLVNRGGGVFEPAPENATAGLWRNSFQATWSDFDRDGDPDIYVANDWAPDNFLRNDGAAGFTDITAEAGTTAYGFAMGASWGDYDNDGREDLYVSNMYSKAGRRITAEVPGIAQKFIESAQGNWLYRQDRPGHFVQSAGLEPQALPVMKAGWSWGGKFADFDNDGWLDLYVLSGYFTAPKELSSELDL